MGSTEPTEPRDLRKVFRPAGGRDELNLAEFPITLLADRVPEGCKTLVFEDQIYDQQAGEMVMRKLTITGSDEFGLPTAIDDEILVALIQVTKLSNNFTSARVGFSRYELIRLLGWPDDGKSYRRLEESLNRWIGVTLYYDKAWWNKDAQSWVSEKFHILENVSLLDRATKRKMKARGQEELALSSFTWNQVVFRSFQAENLKRLDLDTYFGLRSAVSKRMYRFLDKRFYHRRRWEFDLREFAFEHIGLSRSYDDNGKIKAKLDPAIAELTAAGFLEPLGREGRYIKLRQGHWKIVLIQGAAEAEGKPRRPEVSGLAQELIDRGITAAVAAELVEQFAADRIRGKIEVFDWIRQKGDRRLRDNPAGYLVQSIREDYAAPPGFESRAERSRRQEFERQGKRREVEERRRLRAEQAREAAEYAQLARYWTALSPEEKARLEAEALAQAEEPLLESFQKSRGTPLEPIARRLIREAHIRKRLGLAAPPPAT